MRTTGMLILLMLPLRLVAADGTAGVAGTDKTVRVVRAASRLLLRADQAAAAFGFEAKTVTPGKLITLCRTGRDGFCVPVRIDDVPHQKSDDGLYVDAQTLGRALRFEVEEIDGAVTLNPLKARPAGQPAVTSYNADWGKQRGFAVGQTVPDIPLYDLEGNEVRFSRFLGKQYIIYCWASW